MSEFGPASRGEQLQSALDDLLAQVAEIEAAAVVSFDGLPMASALPDSMNEDRVAAMSAALLSLGEKAAEGLGRGGLSQVFVEGEHGTVFLVACQSEAVLVAVAGVGAKSGLVLYEVRRTASSIAATLSVEDTRELEPAWQHAAGDGSADFVAALADAEAAYEAHRAETSVFQSMSNASMAPDLNVVYTPHSAVAPPLQEPLVSAQEASMRAQMQWPSTDPVLSTPAEWNASDVRNADASSS